MNDAAIVGVGCTGFRSISPEVSYKELMFEAATRASKTLELILDET